MVNLFESFQNASEEDLRAQIAMLKVVTFGNVMKKEAAGAGKKIVGGAKKVLGFFGVETSVEGPAEIDLNERIEREQWMLRNWGHAKLLQELRTVVTERINLSPGTSDEEVSSKVIEMAAKDYDDIKKNVTIAEKADLIAKLYIQGIYDAQDKAQQAKIGAAVDERLSEMTSDELEKIKRAYNIDQVTSETLLPAMRKVGATAGSYFALNSMGFGLYLASTAILKAVATTALTISLPFAAYTGLTGAIGVALGPVGACAIGIYALWKGITGQQEFTRKTLVPFLVTSYALRRRPFAPTEESLGSWAVYREIQEKKLADAINSEYGELKKKLENLTSTGYTREDLERELKDKEATIRAEMEAQIRRINAEADRKIHDANMKIADARKREEAIQQILEEKQEMNEKLNLQLKDKDEEIKACLAAFEERSKELSKENQELKREVHEGKTIIEETRRKYTVLHMENEKLQEENAAMKKQLDDYQQRMTWLQDNGIDIETEEGIEKFNFVIRELAERIELENPYKYNETCREYRKKYSAYRSDLITSVVNAKYIYDLHMKNSTMIIDNYNNVILPFLIAMEAATKEYCDKMKMPDRSKLLAVTKQTRWFDCTSKMKEHRYLLDISDNLINDLEDIRRKRGKAAHNGMISKGECKRLYRIIMEQECPVIKELDKLLARANKN